MAANNTNYYGFISGGTQYQVVNTAYPKAPAQNAATTYTYTQQPPASVPVPSYSVAPPVPTQPQPPATYVAAPPYQPSTYYAPPVATPPVPTYEPTTPAPPPAANQQPTQTTGTSYTTYQVPQYQSFQTKATPYSYSTTNTNNYSSNANNASYSTNKPAGKNFVSYKQPFKGNNQKYQGPAQPATNNNPSQPQYNKGNRFYGINNKSASEKVPFVKPPPRPQTYQVHYCEVCKVSCGAPDTYKAHLEGQKHKKKEASLKENPDQTKATITSYRCKLCDLSCTNMDAYNSHIKGAKHQKVVKLHTRLGKPIPSEEPDIIGAKSAENAPSAATTQAKDKNSEPAQDNNDVKPIGEEYVEEVKDDSGKVIGYHCKLCDCPVSDVNAKHVHTKGRRHRVNYKQKVDPQLVIDVKRKELSKEEAIPNFNRPMPMDEKYMLTKDFRIYPKQEDLDKILVNVTNLEKALKIISEELLGAKVDKKDDGSAADANDSDLKILKGVMRVGNLAKGLLLNGDSTVEIVLLFSVKPTRCLLEQVKDLLTKHLNAVDEKIKYEVNIEGDHLLVKDPAEEKPSVIYIRLTSPLMREDTKEDDAPKEGSEILNKEQCLEALAAIRHAKWFQYNASVIPTLSLTVRVMRDLSQRVPAWSCLSQWAIELLVRQILHGVGHPLPPALGFRNILDAVASGFLSPTGPGLFDPCEKEPINVLSILTEDDKAALAESAKEAMAFFSTGQIFKVLGMNPFPRPKTYKNYYPRKRKIESTGPKDATADNKKTKVDDVPQAMDTKA